MCGLEYQESEAAPACSACPRKGCGMVCCPRCGYETPATPRWLKTLFGRDRS